MTETLRVTWSPIWMLVDSGGDGVEACCVYHPESAAEYADDLTDHGNRVYARLRGGVVVREAGAWKPVEDPALARIMAGHLDALKAWNKESDDD